MASRHPNRRATRFAVPSSTPPSVRMKRPAQSIPIGDPLLHVSVSFECCACLDSCSGIPIFVAQTAVCEDCFEDGIKPQFEEALINEGQYPVRWGDAILDPFDYGMLLPRGLLLFYKQKQYEYQTVVKARLYCKAVDRGTNQACNAFVGRKKAGRPFQLTCNACGSLACSKCAGALVHFGKHVCKTDLEVDPFTGMLRGKDYQQCPNSSCQVKVALWDGCNGVKCLYFLSPEVEARIQRREALRVEQERIEGSPEGQVMRRDRHELQRIFDAHYEHQEQRNVLQRLINNLAPALDAHVAHLRTLDRDTTRHQERTVVHGRMRGVINGIRMASERGYLGLQPSLKAIISRYMFAFEGHQEASLMFATPEGQLRDRHTDMLQQIRTEVQRVRSSYEGQNLPVPAWLIALEEISGLLETALNVYLANAISNPQVSQIEVLMHQYDYDKIQRLIEMLSPVAVHQALRAAKRGSLCPQGQLDREDTTIDIVPKVLRLTIQLNKKASP
ncbi:uncharacterized protein MYCFIDRAFT_191739 [Pseudocercospora fijiensis CIRAD86]|uniref:IBR domain-containing protein n=1 Tax=Pseudocercospora fijiensis (strain CIRAD86) TaxID=383855 RepID=N1Q6Z3_PSEFD|nr:uncharacterized protein MYCFIDRAFT_191739 [Pseudocercospora fijiensis CIRAD86]EME87246.1 hypothetical protein MYCFIDRAFT_191739 [Pseudocercospora fijiensis CIRAD86]